MERTLNLNDGWEAVVNNPEKQERIERFHAKRRERKLDKLAMKTAVFGFIAGLFGLFGITGAMTTWISTPVAAIFVALFFFNCGRYAGLEKG